MRLSNFAFRLRIHGNPSHLYVNLYSLCLGTRPPLVCEHIFLSVSSRIFPDQSSTLLRDAPHYLKSTWVRNVYDHACPS